jgi:hypothetical protein
MLKTLQPSFGGQALELAEELLDRLAEAAGLAREGAVALTIGRAIETAIIAARCLCDRISERQFNRLAVALVVSEWVSLEPPPPRMGLGDEAFDHQELAAVEEFVQTSDWQGIADGSLRTSLQRRLGRQALARLSLDDAVVEAVEIVTGVDWEDTFRILDEDPDLAAKRVCQARKQFARALMDVAEDVLVRHGRTPPVRFTTTE